MGNTIKSGGGTPSCSNKAGKSGTSKKGNKTAAKKPDNKTSRPKGPNVKNEPTKNSGATSPQKNNILNGGYTPPQNSPNGEKTRDRFEQQENEEYNDKFKSDTNDPSHSPLVSALNKYKEAGLDGLTKPEDQALQPKFHERFTQEHQGDYEHMQKRDPKMDAMDQCVSKVRGKSEGSGKPEKQEDKMAEKVMQSMMAAQR